MSEIFDRYHKRLTESIHADDVAPRLVQSAILSHEDLSNIRLETSNTRAMKVTLAKLAGLAARGAADWSNWTRRRWLVKLHALLLYRWCFIWCFKKAARLLTCFATQSSLSTKESITY